MKVVAIVQARMGSTRFPGKTLYPIAGKPLLWHSIHRLQSCRTIDQIVIATSSRDVDDEIESFAEALGVGCVRGPEDNVLARFVLAADRYDPEVIVRVNGDAPLIDSDFIDYMVDALIESDSDYVRIQEGISCGHDGVDPFSRRALRKLVWNAGHDPVAREHVTGYFKQHPDFVKTIYLDLEKALQFEGARLSVDTKADIDFVETVHERLGVGAGEADLREVLSLLRREPDLVGINQHVQQKRATQATRRIIIRCDGGPEIGFGHLTRCLSLASAMRDEQGCGILFAGEFSRSARERISELAFPTFSISSKNEDDWFESIVEEQQADAVVIDCRSSLSLACLNNIRSRGVQIVTLDDASFRRQAAHLAVFPPVPQVDDMDWTDFDGVVLTGWEWTILPPPPRGIEISSPQRSLDDPRVLVCCGGSDPFGLTPKIASALAHLHNASEIEFVLGPDVRNPEKLEEQILALDPSFRTLVAPDNLHAALARASVAIVTYGVVAQEAAAHGVPSLYLCLTENDARSAQAMVDAGTGLSVGVATEVDMRMVLVTINRMLDRPKALQRMSEAGRNALDFSGASRLASTIAGLLERQSAA